MRLPEFGATPVPLVVYWVNGDGGGMRASVENPPCSGYQHALVRSVGRNRVEVLCPITLRAFALPVASIELVAALPAWPGCLEAVVKRLSVPHEGAQKSPDHAAVARFLRALDREDLAVLWDRAGANTTVVDGVPAAGGLAGLKPGSRRAQVLDFFVSRGGTGDLVEAQRELGMSRNGVLSHLWGLREKHGVAYTLADGRATVTLPE